MASQNRRRSKLSGRCHSTTVATHRCVPFSLTTTIALYCTAMMHHHCHLPSVSCHVAPTRTNNGTSSFIVSPYDEPPPPSAVISIPLHAIDGTHHVYVYIGSPPQRQTLIVDTGSRLMAFPCEPCLRCGQHASDSYFDPQISTTDLPNDCSNCHFHQFSKCLSNVCQFQQQYTEGSALEAYEMEDIVWFGTENIEESLTFEYMHMAVPFTFGCQTSETGLFKTQYADGIMGLAMQQTTLLDKMYESGSIRHVAFSMCMTRHDGMLSLGGASPRRQLEPMHFVPIVNTHGYFAIQVLAVHLGTILLTNDPWMLRGFNDEERGTIIDSGTTDTYLPKSISKEWEIAWNRWTGKPFTNKRQSYTHDELESLPDLIMTLHGDYQWSIPAKSYMEEARFKKKHGTSSHRTNNLNVLPSIWNGTKLFSNRIYVDEPTNGCVLGGNAMLDHDILFDIQNNRIGIARANCE